MCFQHRIEPKYIFSMQSLNTSGCRVSTKTKTIKPKNTGAWKGRLKMFFVDPYTLELAKNGTNII